MCSWKLNLLLVAALASWTGFIISMVLGERAAEQTFARELALQEAKGSYNKDLVYRRWAARQGGVYVKPSLHTQPNPYLSHLPDRDLTSLSGIELTLVNPAYMTRQVHELAEQQYGALGHITSLNPLRPENAPDAWEGETLRNFEQGQREAIIETMINGQPYLRLMPR
jgi:hypothetical protein